jgi:transcriptional regulator with XRE-family HTH domain
VTRSDIRTARLKAGLPLQTLGPLCQVHFATLSRIECGHIRASESRLLRIMAAISDVEVIKKKYGVPLDLRNLRWLQAEMKKLQKEPAA